MVNRRRASRCSLPAGVARNDRSAGMRPGSGSVRLAVAATFLLVLTAVIYWPVGSYDFIGLDDLTHVSGNPLVNRGLSVEGVLGSLSSFQSGFWIPLTWISLMIDVSLFGLRAGPMHLVNAALHAANALLVLIVLHRMTGSFWRSAAVAALFVAHPLRVESVAWVIERKDLLSTLFFLLALYAYVRFTRRKSPLCLAAAALGMAASLMSKPMLVTFPALLLLVDYWPLGRWSGAPEGSAKQTAARVRGLFLEKVPFMLLAAACGALLIAAQQSVGSLYTLEIFPFSARLGRAAASSVVYIQRFFWPVGLRFGPPLGPHELPWGQQAVAAILLATITAWVLINRKSRPQVAAGWFWYLVALLPVSGLVPSGRQGFENRFTYVPHLGLCIMLVWLAVGASRHSRRAQRAVALIAAISVLSLVRLSRQQVDVWRDGPTLFGDAVRRFPDDSWSRQLLGDSFQHRGQHDPAIDQFEQILARQPGEVTALWSLGVSLGASGRIEEARAHFDRALVVDPANPDAHFNLAVALKTLGRADEAEMHYRQALLARPSDLESRINLVLLLLDKGLTLEAREHCMELVRQVPHMPSARECLDLTANATSSGDWTPSGQR